MWAHHPSSMSLLRRLPALSIAVGVLALIPTIPRAISYGSVKELPWVAGSATFVLAAAYVWRRRPDHPLTPWFASAGGAVAVVQMLDVLILRALTVGDATALAWTALAFHLTMVLAVITIAHLIGLFPDGRMEHDHERRLLRPLWLLLLLPPLATLSNQRVFLPSYHQAPDVPNPLHVEALRPLALAAGTGVALSQAVFALGVVLLAMRYRRADHSARRRIRWLLVPALFAACVTVIDIVAWRLFPDGAPIPAAEAALSAMWIVAIASLPVALSIALLRPDLVDVDRVLRKSLVYGSLWALIVVVYVGAAAGLGIAAGQRLPIGIAILLTVLATLLFHPARQRLERLADRWVFGIRTDPAQVVSRLGETLAETFDLEVLLPRMASTLEQGLGLRWARVRLTPFFARAEGPEPALSVPITLGDETLGVVECGPRTSGAPLTVDDEAVVSTLARQAALAVRNVRLTGELTAQAAELAASRERLVRSQESERRRIERNIHDGAQQDLVALIGHTAHVRSVLARDPQAGMAALDELQEGLRRVITDLRELAHGIHPSILSDRGLLEAVEALAARSAVQVDVRADASLRTERFTEAIEGAGYFTVAESLANASKHAAANHVEVTLARANGSIRIGVRDDGIGFDPTTASGEGLRNLAERLAALGGRLAVESAPGVGTAVTATLTVTEGETVLA